MSYNQFFLPWLKSSTQVPTQGPLNRGRSDIDGLQVLRLGRHLRCLGAVRVDRDRCWFRVRSGIPSAARWLAICLNSVPIFQRCSPATGTIDPVGGASGPTVQADGTFEYAALPGRYSIEVCEFSPTEPDGRIRMLRRFGKATINFAEADLDGVETQISSEDLA
jgi:hypothetical protein